MDEDEYQLLIRETGVRFFFVFFYDMQKNLREVY